MVWPYGLTCGRDVVCSIVVLLPMTLRVCQNGKWLPDFIERLKASAWHQLYLPLLPFAHARSESN